MFKKLLAAGFALALIFALGLTLGFLAKRWLPLGGVTSLNTATIVTRVQTLSQLVTVKYVLEKVVVLEDAKWYGENRVLLVAHGVAKAGVDLSRLKAGDFHISGQTVSVTLPKASITDVYLDDNRTQVIERSTGLMREFDKDLEQNARKEAVEDLRRAAMQDGIVKDAQDRAQAQLANLFYQLGFTQVDFHSGK
jgi:hypothetical protein